MGTPFYVELACEALTYVTNHRNWDSYYDKIFSRKKSKSSSSSHAISKNNNTPRAIAAATAPSVTSTVSDPTPLDRRAPRRRIVAAPILASAIGSNTGAQRRYKNQLPDPEPDRDYIASQQQQQQQQDYGPARRRDNSLERQSETSERVLREYEAERTDPPRKVDHVLPGNMAHQGNGYNPQYRDDGYDNPRPRSQPPRSRYADDDSDYDEHEGRRYRGANAGRGYDDDRDYDREIIETERYRGPARGPEARRMDSYGSRGYDGPYGDGAMAPYRRSQGDVTDLTRRSSRGRRDRDDDRSRSRSRSYSDSRSRSRSRGKGEKGFKGEIDKYFDTSSQGIGVGIAGAVAGGLAGRHFGARSSHKNRDIILGALVGGIVTNAAENKYREWREEREERKEREENRLEAPQRYDGRSRSSNR